MKKALKAVICSLFTIGFILIAGYGVIKADVGPIVADLNNDGTVETVTYKTSFKMNDDMLQSYKFTIYINDKKAYSENHVIEEASIDEAGEYQYDDMEWLGSVSLQLVDINPSDNYKELIAYYYASEDNVVLAYKVFRLKKGKLKHISTDYTSSSYSYIPAKQKNDKYLTICQDIMTPAFGTIWIYQDVKVTKDSFISRRSKSGVYTVAPNFYESGSSAAFTAATHIKVMADTKLSTFKGEIKAGEKFTLKKVKFTNNDEFASFLAYVKTKSGLKGWIYVDNSSDEWGCPLEDLVVDRRLFS
ncbi:MAG: hypothetical protein IK007_06005 [Lachnospiraceae bacterium]|nr:hypothetical protein [Lachnospiraceae bacterium]